MTSIASEPDFKIEQTQQARRTTLNWLFGFVTPHRQSVVVLLVLSLIASCLVLVQPWLTKQIIDVGLLGKDFDALLVYCAAMLGITIASTALSGITRYWHTSLSAKVLFALRETVYKHLQTLSPGFYLRHRTGDLLSRLDGDVAEIQRFAIDGLFASVSGVIGFVGSVGLLFYLNAQLALIALILLPLDWVYLRFMRPRVESGMHRVRELGADISSFLVETLPAMKFVQTVSAEEREARRLTGLNQNYLNGLLKLQLTEFATQAVPNTLTSVSRALVFLLGGYWVIQGDMALGALIAFSSYLGMAVGPIHTLLGLYVAVRRMRVSLDRVRVLTESQPDIDLNSGENVMPTTLRGDIRFEKVSFSYPDGEQHVFEGASAYLPAGTKVGVKGASGIGKTTLVDLLLRHFDPDQGVIRIDDRDLRDFNLSAWRQKVAVVAQDIVLFRGTLAENIRYTKPDATREEIMAAIERAQLADFVAQLPDGPETFIGEWGGRLSGGQRQRLAVARALLQDPVLLILDEATSAVDEETERQMIETVDRLFHDRTRLVISHRERPLDNADWLLTITGGQFEIGRP